MTMPPSPTPEPEPEKERGVWGNTPIWIDEMVEPHECCCCQEDEVPDYTIVFDPCDNAVVNKCPDVAEAVDHGSWRVCWMLLFLGFVVYIDKVVLSSRLFWLWLFDK